MTDSSRSERYLTILHRLSAHYLDDLGCAVVTPNESAWTRFDLPYPYRYGWMPPLAMGSDEVLVVSFCPALIARTTDWLDDEQLDTYLTVIEAFIDAMVAHSSLPAVDVYQSITDVLLRDSPGAMGLVSLVEARALDDGVVARASQVD